MSEYIKQNFASGQILTADQLNYIEDGITKILPVIEAGEQQLVTDADGNVVWESKTHGYTVEEVVLYENYEFTATRVQQMQPPSIALEVGQHFKMTVNGVDYEGTVEIDPSGTGLLKISAGYIVLVGLMPGVTQQLRNFTNASGTLTLTVTAKIYKTIDKEYMPISCASGSGTKSVILNDAPSSVASGVFSLACNKSEASGNYALACNMGYAVGFGSFAHGVNTHANGNYSYAGGSNTIASSKCQHAIGQYNLEDSENKYAYIVGNGEVDLDNPGTPIRSNAYTLDWSGNAWYAGDVEGTSMIVKSSTEGSTKRFRITVDDSGTLSATEIV